MALQKFKRGDLISVEASDAIILGSYADLYGGAGGTDSYSLLFTGSGCRVSWYQEYQLTFLRHVGEDAIREVEREKKARDEIQSDLGWIVEHWSEVRKAPSGATMCALMALIGIGNPWGSHGEGITYYSNCGYAYNLLDSVLASGSVQRVQEFVALVRK